MTLEPRTTRHSAPAAVVKQSYSTNPERAPACSRRHSNSCHSCQCRLMPSEGLWRTLPREAALPQIKSCLRVRGHGCRRSWWQLLLRPDAGAAASACEPQETQAPRRDHDQCMSGSIGVKTIGLEHNDFNCVLLTTFFNTQVTHARAEDGLCVTDDGVHC